MDRAEYEEFERDLLGVEWDRYDRWTRSLWRAELRAGTGRPWRARWHRLRAWWTLRSPW